MQVYLYGKTISVVSFLCIMLQACNVFEIIGCSVDLLFTLCRTACAN